MIKLEIENNPKLLTEYGRAFAWINYVEILLRIVIEGLGGFYKLKYQLENKILNEKTFGQKIELAKYILEPDLIKNLNELKKDRNILAHGIIEENISDPKMKKNTYRIKNKNNDKLIVKQFTLKELKKITKDAKQIYSMLLKKEIKWMEKD